MMAPAPTVPPPNLSAVLRPTASARGLPNLAYVDDGYWALERERIFARTWSCIGFTADLPGEGSARPYELMGVPLFAVRRPGGEIAVYHNVCSHRGQQLVGGPCRMRGAIRCPYHAWTYDFGGRLRGTPHIGGPGVHELAGFDRSEHGLAPVRADTWLGLIFVDLSGSAPSLAEHVAPLQARWEALCGEGGFEHLGAVDSGGSLELEIRANWKLAVENYCEAYHLPWIHPDLNRYSRLEDHYSIIEGELGAGQGSLAYRLAETAGIRLARFPAWNDAQPRTAEYFALFPNVLLGIQPDHQFGLVLEPRAPDRTLERLQIQYVGDRDQSPELAGARNAVLEAWRVVFGEDVAVVEGMQRGRRSPAYNGGAFSPVMDPASHHFHRWVAARMGGE